MLLAGIRATSVKNNRCGGLFGVLSGLPGHFPPAGGLSLREGNRRSCDFVKDDARQLSGQLLFE